MCTHRVGAREGGRDEGGPIVLLHGLMGRGRTWRRQIPWLRRYGRVFTYDAAFHTGADAALISDPAEVSTERFVADLAEILAVFEGLDRHLEAVDDVVARLERRIAASLRYLDRPDSLGIERAAAALRAVAAAAGVTIGLVQHHFGTKEGVYLAVLERALHDLGHRPTRANRALEVVVPDEIAATDRQVHVLHRPGKQGLGAAYLAGFAWAAERGYDAMIEMDADGSHRPEHLPAMLDAATSADLVIGSRWVKGGETVNWPLSRQLISRGGSLYTRLLLGVPVHDCTAGFRVYRATALEKMALSDVASAGYCFQIDLTRRALDRGLTVVEVPISFVEREIGDSKMNGDIVREAMVRVGQWGVKHRAAQLGRLLGWRPGESWHDLT